MEEDIRPVKSMITNQYIEFEVSGEQYAISISDIHEIIRMQDITDIPNCQHYVQGVINLRGKVVAVISLSALFAVSPRTPDKFTRIVVVSHREESVGIIVDKVNKVTAFTDIQPPPERIVGVNGAYFTGIGMTETGLVGILKLEEVLLREFG
jgi:purine-binding chemotaxis protein CheW